MEPERPVLGPGLVALLTVACGATLANNYYAQPLLNAIGLDLGTSAATAALLVTASQLGYAAGILFVSPLGDIVRPRVLVTRLAAVTAAGLVVCVAAPSFALLGFGLVWVGTGTVLVVVLIALGGELAAEHQRGQVVGTLIGGMLGGLLVARTVSGVLGELTSWRTVFAASSVVMVALALALSRALPDVEARAKARYGALLRSIVGLVREERRLRVEMVYGALAMGAFSTLWTSLALLLAGPPYSYGEATIGLFGLVGLIGIGAAQLAGRLVDAGRAQGALGVLFAVVLAGWALCAAGEHSLVLLIAGIVAIDFGVQGVFTIAVSRVISVRPEASSRVMTAFEGHLFLWGAAASALTAAAWSLGGWQLVTTLGASFIVAALLLWFSERRLPLPDVGNRAPAGVGAGQAGEGEGCEQQAEVA